MEAEPTTAEEQPSCRQRFRNAVDTLRRFAADDVPIQINATDTLELGYSSVVFDLRGSATETPRRTRYSMGIDGRLYGAVDGQPQSPVGGVEAETVLKVLESQATALSVPHA